MVRVRVHAMHMRMLLWAPPPCTPPRLKPHECRKVCVCVWWWGGWGEFLEASGGGRESQSCLWHPLVGVQGAMCAATSCFHTCSTDVVHCCAAVLSGMA